MLSKNYIKDKSNVFQGDIVSLKKLPLIRSGRRSVRWFGYVVYLFSILIILGAIFGENNRYTPSKTYSCPAEKYMLTGSDFDEFGWIVGENTDELPS